MEQKPINPGLTNDIPEYVRILIGKDADDTLTYEESMDLIEWIDEDKGNWDLFEQERKSYKEANNSNH